MISSNSFRLMDPSSLRSNIEKTTFTSCRSQNNLVMSLPLSIFTELNVYNIEDLVRCCIGKFPSVCLHEKYMSQRPTYSIGFTKALQLVNLRALRLCASRSGLRYSGDVMIAYLSRYPEEGEEKQVF